MDAQGFGGISGKLLVLQVVFHLPAYNKWIPALRRDLTAHAVDVQLQHGPAGIATTTHVPEDLLVVLCVPFRIAAVAIQVAALATFMLVLGIHLPQVLL